MSLQAIVERFHAHQTATSDQRVYAGLLDGLGDLPDPSLAAENTRLTDARSLLGELSALDRSTLSFDDALDADLIELTLSRDIHLSTLTFNGKVTSVQTPAAGADVGGALFMIFANDPREASDRLMDITSRLEQVPAYLDALEARLDVPVARWVDMETQRIAGLPSFFDNLVDWGAGVGFADQARLEAARTAASEALVSYGRRLAELPTATDFQIGDAAAREVVRLRGIDASLEVLHGYAREFLGEVREELEGLRGTLNARYGLPAATTAEALHAHLNERFQVQGPGGNLDDILERYRTEHAKILAFNEEHQLFPIFAEQDIQILRTPAFMEPSIPAGAMMPPPAFRDGVRCSLVYLTLSDALLDEHTELGIPSMMIHEGIPGHHLQLATAGRHPSLVRRHTDAMDQAEGWTTMLEDYMLDVGYMGELVDEARFVGKREIARIGARVAIDLYFMTGDASYLEVGYPLETDSDDPFVVAGALLRQVTGFTPERCAAELNWYSQERGYPLSYLTGNRLVWNLKRDVEKANTRRLGARDLDRAFHRTFLEAGNMPVSFLRRVFANEGLL